MRRMMGLTLAVVGLLNSPTPAHYNMLLPQAASGKKGEPITFTYQWGHPFEHQLFDAPAPQAVIVVSPNNKKADLTKTLTKITLDAGKGKKVTAWQFRYTPERRGDYLFLLKTPPIWLEDDRRFVQDVVKVVVHVQAQAGWDRDAGLDTLELLPLTRPYGLEPGMVFQARVAVVRKSRILSDRNFEPQAFSLVEIERYNPTAPAELPPDEQITRTARTDPNAVVTTTLTDAGWWCLTAARPVGTRSRDGKTYPVVQRATLWVFVAEKPKARR